MSICINSKLKLPQLFGQFHIFFSDVIGHVQSGMAVDYVFSEVD